MQAALVNTMTGKTKKVRKAVMPVAGLGTRFLPATKAIPKEMLPVVDKPLIQYAVEECLASGIDHIIFVTGRGKSAIEDHFDLAPELDSLARAARESGPGEDGSASCTAARTSVSRGSARRWGWATRCFARRTSWATSRSPFCCLT